MWVFAVGDNVPIPTLSSQVSLIVLFPLAPKCKPLDHPCIKVPPLLAEKAPLDVPSFNSKPKPLAKVPPIVNLEVGVLVPIPTLPLVSSASWFALFANVPSINFWSTPAPK